MRLADADSGGGAKTGDGAAGEEGDGGSESPTGGHGVGSSALYSDADEPDSEVITLFATGDADVVVGASSTPGGASSGGGASAGGGGSGCSVIQQDSLAVEHPHDALLGIGAPYVQLLLRSDAVGAGGSRIALRTMRDYVGLEDAEEATREWGGRSERRSGGAPD